MSRFLCSELANREDSRPLVFIKKLGKHNFRPTPGLLRIDTTYRGLVYGVGVDG